jgi:hypothetical protein
VPFNTGLLTQGQRRGRKKITQPTDILGCVLWLRADLGITAVMSAVTATGTSPPTVTLSGTPLTTQTIASTPYVELDVTTGGALGTAVFQVKLNGTVILTGLNTGSSVALTGTGLTASWAVGVSSTNDVYTANVLCSQWNDQSGQGNNFAQATNTMRPQATATDGPNGTATLTFVSANTTTLTKSAVIVQPNSATLSVVAKWTSAPASNAYAINIGNSSTNGIGLAINSAKQRFINLNGAAQVGSSVYSLGIWEDWIGSSGTAYQSLLVNGAILSTGTTTGVTGTSQSQIGSINGSVWLVDGAISEIIVYNRNLSTAEAMQLRQYYQVRYGT